MTKFVIEATQSVELERQLVVEIDIRRDDVIKTLRLTREERADWRDRIPDYLEADPSVLADGDVTKDELDDVDPQDFDGLDIVEAYEKSRGKQAAQPARKDGK